MQIFVARQPIFDRRRRVEAYELVFRSGPENVFSHGDGDEASSRVIDGTLQSFGLESLTNGKPAFINITRRLLVEGLCTLLPPQHVVIELLETIEPDDDVLRACRELKGLGFTLALDDFVFDEKYTDLLELADIVKVDFRLQGPDERRDLVARLKGTGTRLLAEKVETHADLAEGTDAGYQLFQGYFFCKPEMMSGRDIPRFKLNYLRFLDEVNRPELDLDGLEQVIKQEMSLSVKLLRYLNSAAFGWRHEVESIQHAIRLLGERQMKKWASLVALTGLGEDKPAELAVSSLFRARFCEQLGEQAGLHGRELELFLLGLLSRVDAFLDRPLSEALTELQITADVRRAILQNGSPLSPVFKAVSACEEGAWAEIPRLASELQVSEDALARLYREAMEWTDQALSSAA